MRVWSTSTDILKITIVQWQLRRSWEVSTWLLVQSNTTIFPHHSLTRHNYPSQTHSTNHCALTCTVTSCAWNVQKEELEMIKWIALEVALSQRRYMTWTEMNWDQTYQLRKDWVVVGRLHQTVKVKLTLYDQSYKIKECFTKAPSLSTETFNAKLKPSNKRLILWA